jgi:predicted AAA+ superfamily ATPase
MGYWVKGLRQVGKTSLLEKFGKERYKSCIIFDLSDEEIRTSIEHELNRVFSELGYSAYDKRYACAAFTKLVPSFADDPSTLLILDEIQDSRSIYNRARKIVRGLNAKVAFSGSHLGNVIFWDSYNDPTGDVQEFSMQPVSYIEFLNSIKGLEDYMSLREFTRGSDAEALRSAKKYWEIYCELGGFPASLTNFLQHGNLESAKNIRDEGLNKYLATLSEKSPIHNVELWKNVVNYIISSIIQGNSPNDLVRNKHIYDRFVLEFGISEKLISDAVQWMLKSDILGLINVKSDFEDDDSYFNIKYSFNHYALLSNFAEMLINRDVIAMIKGARDEDFVLNGLISFSKPLNLKQIFSYHSPAGFPSEEVDFFFYTQEGVKVLVEVKNSKGKTISSDRILADKRADFLIKFCEGTGFVKDNTFTMPMWNIDKLSIIIPLIDQAYLNKTSLEDEYKRFIDFKGN